jgi:hypothetical protein
MVGVALHLVSAVAVAGRLGLTAIGADPADAERRFEGARPPAPEWGSRPDRWESSNPRREMVRSTLPGGGESLG